MSVALVGVMLLAGFAVCAWSGWTLAHHYQDGLEVAAILAVAGCVLAALVLTQDVRDAGNSWPAVTLALGMTGGLFVGYMRSGPLR